MATEREAQLLLDATKAGITSPKELANFMAQVSEESQGLTHLEEGFRYPRGISQIPVQSAHRDGDVVLETARVDAMQGKPEKLAELMYGGRNGNDQPGDGYMYRGRGYIQLTGKANYQEAGEALGGDLVKKPELAAEPQNASKIATWFWENKVPEAAHSDVRAATAAINGGYNGLEARQSEFDKWEKVLTPEVMQHLSKGEVSLPIEPATTDHHKGRAAESVLKQGATGEAVRALQSDLGALGYTDSHGQPLQADGHFGRDTSKAVEKFQKNNGLQVDGVAGAATRVTLNEQRQNLDHARGPYADRAKAVTKDSSTHDMFEAICSAASRGDTKGMLAVGKCFEQSPEGQSYLAMGAQLNQQQAQIQAQNQTINQQATQINAQTQTAQQSAPATSR